MSALSGSKLKVYIETEDGLITEVSGMVESLTYRPPEPELIYDHVHEFAFSVPVAGCGRLNLEMKTGEFLVLDHKEMEQKKTSEEWKCSFCGRPNKRERTTCEGCGSVRSFIYD